MVDGTTLKARFDVFDPAITLTIPDKDIEVKTEAPACLVSIPHSGRISQLPWWITQEKIKLTKI